MREHSFVCRMMVFIPLFYVTIGQTEGNSIMIELLRRCLLNEKEKLYK